MYSQLTAENADAVIEEQIAAFAARGFDFEWKWYSHDVEKWTDFQRRYEDELARHGELLDLIGDIERHRKTVTLLFGAKDEDHNEANVLVDVLKKRSAQAP